MATYFKTLEQEPRPPNPIHSKPFGAPPPYRSTNSIPNEDDSSSGLWSESSFGSGKRRTSWTNLVEADENLRSLKANAYPKVASGLPQKTPIFHTNYSQQSTQIGTDSRPTSISSSNFVAFVSLPTVQLDYSKGKPMSYRPNYTLPPMPAASSSDFPSNIPAGMMGPPRPGSATTAATAQSKPKTDKMGDIRRCWEKPASKICCLAVLIALIASVVIAVVLTQWLALPNHLALNWLAPELYRQGSAVPSHVVMDVADQQVRMELTGATPFSNNYVSILDFRTNKVAIVDSGLKSGTRNIICFVMDLDRGSIRSIEEFQRAARNSEKKRTQTRGWDETWSIIPQVSNTPHSQNFRPEVSECRGARWVELNTVTAHQKNQKCTDCFDFCVPEYGIERDNIRDESYLNILRRNCFHLFVPEWRGYAYQQSNQLPPNFPPGQGGPIDQLGMSVSNIAEDIQSKWINVQQLPQQIANASQNAFQNVRSGFNQWQNQMGQLGQQLGQQLANPQPQQQQIFGSRPPTPSELLNTQTVAPIAAGLAPPGSAHPFGPQQFPIHSNQPQQQQQPNHPQFVQNPSNVPIRVDDPIGLSVLRQSNNQPPIGQIPQQQWQQSGGNQWQNVPQQQQMGGFPQPQSIPSQQFGMDLSSSRQQQQQSGQFIPQQNQGWVNVGSG